jgi:hypothetical protein
LAYVFSQNGAAPGWKSQSPRRVRFLKIIDVTPFVRCGLSSGALLQKGPHIGVFARPGGPQQEQVETAPLDTHSELDRLQGAILPDKLTEVLEFGRVLERELPCFTAPVECFGC